MNVRRSAYRIPGGSMLKFTKTDRENTNNNEIGSLTVSNSKNRCKPCNGFLFLSNFI